MYTVKHGKYSKFFKMIKYNKWIYIFYKILLNIENIQYFCKKSKIFLNTVRYSKYSIFLLKNKKNDSWIHILGYTVKYPKYPHEPIQTIQ